MTEDDLFAESGDDNALPILHGHLETAATKLKAFAVDKFQAPPLPPFVKSGDFLRKGPIDLEGFWPLPPSKNTPKIPPAVSVDINRFLGLNRFPHTLGSDGNAVDVGEEIAKLMFAEVVPEIDSDKEPPHVPFTLETGDGTVISGGHVYYRIPVGNSDQHNGWHSHLRLWMIMPVKTQTELDNKKQRLAIQPRVELMRVQ